MNEQSLNIKTIYLNFGPQHPAAHGVIRLVAALHGEQVMAVEPHIGLLHRGTEKIIEYKSIKQSLPYFDRLDYVSMLANEHTFILAVERLNNNKVNYFTQLNRVLLIELTRLLNHLLALTTHAMDVGALTPFIWVFEEREKILEFYERITGARMHANLFTVSGLSQLDNFPTDLLNDLYKFLDQFSSRLNEIEELLTTNRIWINRLHMVGVISSMDAINYSFSGPLIRSTGVKWDIRKTVPYEVYPMLQFSVPVGTYGDCYDRYLIRLYELRQSVSILYQIINLNSCKNSITISSQPGVNPISNSMEGLIYHFRGFTADLTTGYLQNIIDNNDDEDIINKDEEYLSHHNFSTQLFDIEVYSSTESPKGELGVYIVQSEFSDKIYRCKIRAPGFFHLQGLNLITQNHLIADLVTIIGTQDLVFGEIDR